MSIVIDDINCDGLVNIFDLVRLASLYGCRKSDSRWNWEADLATPYGFIDILDLVACTSHYGERV